MTKPWPILAQHSGSCPPCRGKIFVGDPIVKAEAPGSPWDGKWVHAECAPAEDEGAEG